MESPCAAAGCGECVDLSTTIGFAAGRAEGSRSPAGFRGVRQANSCAYCPWIRSTSTAADATLYWKSRTREKFPIICLREPGFR